MTDRSLVALFIFLIGVGCSGRPEEKVRERCIPQGKCADISTEFRQVPGDKTRGASLFREHCATCHGVEARGIPSKSSQDLTDPTWQKKTKDSGIRNVIQIGQGMKMPAFRFDQQQLADLVQFIRSVARNE